MSTQYLYSPWRLQYILSHKETECILCHKPAAQDDEKHLIVHRSTYCYVIMNLYPYNNGHIMVVPYRHVNTLAQLNAEELQDVFHTVQLGETILKETYNAEGVNIGMNVGKAAGAGIDEHIHVHLVPRWLGDGNFMTVTGGIRVIPESFDSAWRKLKTAFDIITGVK